MASRLTIGIDPGLEGAIAVLADGEAGVIIDMPLLRVGEGNEVDARQFAMFIRAARDLHPGAAVSATIERVRAMPPTGFLFPSEVRYAFDSRPVGQRRQLPDAVLCD